MQRPGKDARPQDLAALAPAADRIVMPSTNSQIVHEPLDRDSVVYVAGHHGLVGSAAWRHLTAEGLHRLVGAPLARPRPAGPGLRRGLRSRQANWSARTKVMLKPSPLTRA